MWKINGYVSANIAIDETTDNDDDEGNSLLNLDNEDDEDDNEDGNGESKKQLSLNYVFGDVTCPKKTDSKVNIILHCTGIMRLIYTTISPSITPSVILFIVLLLAI